MRVERECRIRTPLPDPVLAGFHTGPLSLIELEFREIVFFGGGEHSREFGENPCSKAKTSNKLSPHVTLGPAGGGGGLLDIFLGREVRHGPSYPDPV